MKEEDYIKKWLDSSLSDEEKKLFAQPKKFEVDVSMSEALSRFKAEEYDVDKEYDFFRDKKSNSKKSPASRSYVLLKIAAIFIMVLGFVVYITSSFYSSDVDLLATKMELSLPDDTKVILNAESKLSYDEDSWSEKRQAILEGEVFFSVTKGSRFDVVSQSGKVSVLGTSFNVKDREDFFEVKCYEGLVKVEVDGEEFLLTAQQAYRMIYGRGQKIAFYEKIRPSWTKGASSFEKEPYIQVIQELERQYGVSISYQNINTQRSFSGKFTHSDLTLALESITKPLNIGFEVAGQEVRLSSDIKQN